MSSIKEFLRSKPGAGFIKFALFSTLLAAGVGYGTYSLNLRWYVASKGEEKTTALQLVDAFVTNYSEIRGHFGSDKVPVPATFRAHSIELFNRMRDADNVLRLQWVGRAGRAIATPPADAAMAATIESFEGEANPTARSSLLTVGHDLVFRTVYPSTATQESCVDCHNRLQPDKPQWHVNDVMGAFSIDVPAGPFLRTNLMQSIGLGLALSLGLSSVGFFVAVQSFRSAYEREAAQARLKESEKRFRAFAESASDWFWEQDEQLRFTYVSEPVEKSGVPIRAHIGKTRREIVSMRRHRGTMAGASGRSRCAALVPEFPLRAVHAVRRCAAHQCQRQAGIRRCRTLPRLSRNGERRHRRGRRRDRAGASRRGAHRRAARGAG